jgi:threonylcarbamoyladenosine tRNA methylthiotransferase MtaB
MKNQIPNTIKQERSHRLLAHAQMQEQKFAARYIGQALPVLWEQVGGASEAGFINGGYTPNYLRVQAMHPRILTNMVTPCVIDTVAEGMAHGVPVLQ